VPFTAFTYGDPQIINPYWTVPTGVAARQELFGMYVAGSGGGIPSLVAQNLAGGIVGVSYSETISAEGGTSPYTFSVLTGSVPSGTSLNTSSGVISGTPSAAGTYNFTIEVMDSSGNVNTQAFQIIITANDVSHAFVG